MDKYVEAYGAVYNKLFFFAVRFKKPIINVKIKDSSEKIDTSNIIVLHSKKPITTNTLMFAVKSPGHSDAISVNTGHELELILALLNADDILNYCFHKSVLYGVGSPNAISFAYKPLPKTVAFKALYKITRAYQNKCINIYHFVLCHYFRRNNLPWAKWQSWFYFIKHLINDEFKKKTGLNITLQIIKRIKKILNNSLKIENYKSELNFCEIALDETNNPGILCASNQSVIYYISPMIVGEQFYSSLPIKDKNNVSCNLWFPLFTDHWFDTSIYFYIKCLSLNTKYIQQILKVLNNTTIEKYKLIQKNVTLLNQILAR